MKIVIVTGMSGAGKRTALKVLEDAGYYCVDNLPVELVLKFVELAMASSRQVNIAIGVDVRVGDTFRISLRCLSVCSTESTNMKSFSGCRR